MSNLKIGRNDCFLMFLVFILHYFNNYVFWSGILTFWAGIPLAVHVRANTASMLARAACSCSLARVFSKANMKKRKNSTVQCVQ